MVSAWRCVALSAMLVACLPDNPAGDGDATSADTDDPTDTDTDGPPPVPETSVLGCPAGETCPMLFVAQAFDDRVEIFAPEDPTNAYRGAIGFDFRPGIDSTNLDEPFGIALSDGFLHVVAGHYPIREEGTLVSIPRSLLGEFDAPATIPVSAIFAGGVFQGGVVGTDFAVSEPIYVHPRVIGGRLLVGTFNNDLFSPEDQWSQPGMVHIVDAADPTQLAAVDLSALAGGACNGAGEVIVFEGGTEAAVACDGNEAVAFLDLPDLSVGTVQDVAAGITGELCNLPPLDNRRVRHLAAGGGAGNVAVAVGPGGTGDTTGTAQIYFVSRANCAGADPRQIGMSFESSPGHIIQRGDEWLVASASLNPVAKRGLFVIQSDGTICDAPIAGFDWSTPVTDRPNDPFALALSADGGKLAVGAGPLRPSDNVADTAYGKVLWVTLEGSGCGTTASAIVDLTDGGPGHAPAPNPADPATVRQQPYVVVLDEVSA